MTLPKGDLHACVVGFIDWMREGFCTLWHRALVVDSIIEKLGLRADFQQGRRIFNSTVSYAQ